MVAIPFSYNLAALRVSPDANAGGLTVLESDGLHVESGLPYNAGLDATNLYTTTVIATINALEPFAPQTLTTAELENIPLVAGTQVVIDADYYPGDFRYDDFAFSMFQNPAGALSPIILGSSDNYNATGNSHIVATYNIAETGNFNLLFGSADAGDNLESSALVIHSISLVVPAGQYTLTGNGAELADGSFINPDGSYLPAGGEADAALFSASAASLVTDLDNLRNENLINQDGGGLIAQDGSGVINTNGSNLINQDGSSLINQDGGSLINQDGSSLINQDGGSLINQDGSSLINQDGSSLLAQNANSLIDLSGNGLVSNASGTVLANPGNGLVSNASGTVISNTGNGLINQDGSALTGNIYHDLSLDEVGELMRQLITTPPPLVAPGGGAAVTGTSFLVSPAAATGSSLYDGNIHLFDSNAHVVALTSGKFAVAWSIVQNASPEDVPIGIGVQLVDADGSLSGGMQIIPSATADTISNVFGLAALPGGGFSITYAEDKFQLVAPFAQTNGLYTQIFDANGNGVGDQILVGPVNSSPVNIAAAALSDGSIVTLLATVEGTDGTESTPQVVVQRVSAAGADIGAAIPVGSSGDLPNDGSNLVGLQNGAFAVAFMSDGASDSGIADGLNVQVFAADGTAAAPVLVRAFQQTGGPSSPAMAMLTNGDFVMAWNENTAVHMQIFTPAGVAVGDVITGELSTNLGDGEPPAITALSDGRFLVAYSVIPPDNGNEYDVHAQIFNADGTPSGDVFAGAPEVAQTFADKLAAVQLADGTVEIVSEHQDEQNVASDIRSEPVSLSGASAPVAAAATQQGRAVDGYIAGSTVFADTNGDGIREPGEATATTDGLGRYNFTTPASGTVILSGGTDVSTGLAFTGTLEAPAGSLTVSSLTTLVAKLVAEGTSLVTAQITVNTALGLAASDDLTTLDPVRDTLESLGDGMHAFVASTMVEDVVSLATAAGAGGDVYGKLAAVIAKGAGVVDLTSVGLMQSLGLTGAAATAAAQLAAASQALLLQQMTADAGNPQAFLIDGASIEMVEQGAASAALTSAAASHNFTPVVAAYTGANLMTTAGVVAGTPTLTGGGANATTDTVLGGDNVIRSVPFGTAPLARYAAPLLAATQPSTTLFIDVAATAVLTDVQTGAVDNASGVVNLTGNAAANEKIAAGSGPFNFIAGSGSGTVAAGGGNDLLMFAGGGNWSASLGNGQDTVVASKGNNIITTGGGANVVAFGIGANVLYSGGADTVFGSTGPDTIHASAIDGSVFVGGSNGNTVTGGAGTQLIFGSSSLNYIGGSGAATVIGGVSGNTVTGGAGNLLMFASKNSSYNGTGGAATVIGGATALNAALGSGGGVVFGSTGGGDTLSAAGSVASVLVGGGTGDVITAGGSGSDILVAGSGAGTVNGAGDTGNLVIFGGPGAEKLTGGGGSDLFFAGAGNETLTGGGGTNTYLFIDSGTAARTDVITDFDPNRNAIGLIGYGSEPGADNAALASATVSGGNTIVALPDRTTIVFTGAPVLNSFNFF